ncbi:uncharacterized protein LOC100216788 [Zea mays]|uniref:Regulator of Vps4 activity in the MVB pathway protein n=2 Tax=Zea mays TaxID=4577 RepID=B4FJQ6_MAIZE|nr:uncharacterized protein LOC100216788 [Zea mays]ACF82349.1 unknown [Zea mays]AQL07916.1 Regulator of Vps4 activity in the MVB pathway protein [Zea mays]|eukprot:NP_001136659.1 uncharacterized protein LOC100216788 [Zea mays]
MGFIQGRTSKQTSRVKTLLRLALSRLAAARRPRLARKSISRSDVGQLLALGHIDRALHRAEQLIEEDNMLEAFNIIELHCNRLIECAKQLDKPHECGDDIREAAAGIMFAARRCGDLPELTFARTILTNKFGGEFAEMAKEGAGVVDPMLVWKLTGNKGDMELKKKVVKEVAAENNVLVDFSELQEVEHGGSGNVSHHHNVSHEGIYQTNMDGSLEPSHDEDPCDTSNSDGAINGHPKQENTRTSVRTRR